MLRSRLNVVLSWLSAGQRRWYLAGTAGLVIVLLVGWWWLAGSSVDDGPRERRYRDVTACLLTDSAGITGERAAPVWAGMQDASLQALVKVQFLAVPDASGVDLAGGYLAGLAQGGCDVIIAVGAAPVDAVVSHATEFPRATFVVVNGGRASSTVSRLDGTAEELPGEIADFVLAELGQ